MLKITASKLTLPSLLLGLSFSLSGCRLEGETSDADTKIQYVPDMADTPTSKPQKSYLDPPEHSVSMTALPYPKTVEEAEKLLQMPPRIAQDPAMAAAGAKLFETYCRVCHGSDGKGKGTLGPAFPMPPDITHESYQKRGDGFFFYRITFGSAVMPSYGHAIAPIERWQIIRHLRTLQGAK